MTRKEAIKLVKEVTGMSLDWDDAHYEALQMAIKALEQEGYYKDLAQSYEKTIVKLTEAVAEQQPSDDCVSRQAILEKINDWWGITSTSGEPSLCDYIRELPSVTPTQRWIPVSERLPEEEGDYLLWGKIDESEEEYLFIGNYDSVCEQFGDWLEQFDRTTLGCLGSEFFEYASVIAWMPLPEPYKAEMESKE